MYNEFEEFKIFTFLCVLSSGQVLCNSRVNASTIENSGGIMHEVRFKGGEILGFRGFGVSGFGRFDAVIFDTSMMSSGDCNTEVFF